ncbi:hypothetical protein [Nibribacter koreensis]|uniref:DUF4468 domain-containing protein n=1 Tax=Nibribacter koreensis TaxID=1084519 RepID=A0ABP8F8T5_9BACT
MFYSFKKHFFSLAFFAFMGHFCFAQNTVIGLAAQNNVKAAASGSLFQTFDNRYEGVRGTPFFMDAWLPGSILIKKNNSGATEEFKNLKLKYDVHGNQLAAVVSETKDTILINANIISSFKVEIPPYTNPVEFRTFTAARSLDAQLVDVFFAVLHDGHNKLLKSVTKRFVKANFKGGYSAGNSYDELVEEAQYYLLNDDRMVKTKLTRKALVEALPAQQEKIKAYITSQKLAMNSEADFISVLAHLDAL